MLRGLALGALALLVGCAGGAEVGPMWSKGDESRVSQLVEGYVAARDARDIPGVEARLAASVDQLTSRGEWRRGVEASVAGMRRSTQQNPGRRTIAIETVRFVAPTVALVDARYTIEREGAAPRQLWSSFTVVKAADGWKIAAIRNMQPAALK